MQQLCDVSSACAAKGVTTFSGSCTPGGTKCEIVLKVVRGIIANSVKEVCSRVCGGICV